MRRMIVGADILLMLLFACAFLAAEPTASQVLAQPAYSGNPKNMKYHNSGCRYFSCKACVVYFSSSSEAKAAGYTACKHCGG